MHRIYDIYDDTEKLLLPIITKEYIVPTFVKQASQDILDRNDKTVFAWETSKRFPLDTPEDVIMSHLYLEKTSSYIPSTEVKFIRENIDRVASFLGISLPSLNKAASVVLSTPLDSFAICEPLDSIPASVISKYASHVYGDHFVLYPLNSEEDVRTANAVFPSGLSDELSYFRPQVAKAIMDKSASLAIRPSHNVVNSLPIPMSTFIEQIDYRIDCDTPKTANYQDIKDMVLSDVDFSPVQLSRALDILDKSTNMLVNEKSAHLLPASEYIRGLQEDRDLNTNVQILDRSIPFNLFTKVASSLKNMYPHYENWCVDSGEAQRAVNRMTSAEKEYIVNNLKGIVQ